MSFRIRWLAVAAMLGIVAVANAQAQRGGIRSQRPTYGYFRYRVPRVNTFIAPRMRLDGAELRFRALERSFDQIDRQRIRSLERGQQSRGRALALAERARGRALELQNRLRDRHFELQDRLRDRHFELQDRAWRRQFETHDRMLERLHERFDQMPRLRVYRPRVRTI